MKLGIRGAIWACARRNTANLSVVDLQLAAWFKSPRMSWTESIIHGCDWSQNVVLGCWSCWCMSYYHAFQKMWVWMHSWVCHGKIIGPAHGTCYQQAHYVLYISCLWCFALAVIPWLKVHLKLKGFNTHVRVYKVAACWKLRVCVRGKHNQKCIQSRPAKGNQGFLSLITVENQLSSWDDMHHSFHDLTLVRIYHPAVKTVARCLDHYWKVLEIERLSVFVIVQQRAPIRLFWCWCTFSLHAS